MQWTPSLILQRRRIRVLDPFIELLRNERLHGFTKNIFCGEIVALLELVLGIIPAAYSVAFPFHPQTGRDGIDVFREVMVEERRAAFDGVRHFAAVAETGQEHVLEIRFAPDVLGRVCCVPGLLHLLQYRLRDVVGQSVFWVSKL